MFYTSEGKRIMRYDLISNVQLPDFASPLAGYAAYALRILPDDSVIVADTEFILHLDSLGNEIQRYDVPGEDTWFALNIDPDGTSFWAGSFGTGRIYKFDIATGGDPLLTIDTGAESKLFGICVYGAQ
jgi:streptogramin lyase